MWQLRSETRIVDRGLIRKPEKQIPADQAPADRLSLRTRFSAAVSPRRREILEIAGRLFARNGYKGTSIREIGEASGVLGGSLYHHIRSKDALFTELHDASHDAAEHGIRDAIKSVGDPWGRLETACAVLLEIQLDPDTLTQPLMNDFRDVPVTVQRILIAKRDRFEDVFRDLVDVLPLPMEIDRSIYRNLLLASLNSASGWYRPGGLGPKEIAHQLICVFRHP
jgi:AcrR family transcriptional regulator